MGIDLGDRRIGLALSDETGLIASPWRTLPSIGPRQDVERVLDLARTTNVSEFVLGVATRLDGSPSSQGERSLAFAQRLGRRAGLPVHLWDESLSTADAMAAMRASGRRRRDRRNSIDAEAAAVILGGFLDAQMRRAAAPAPESAPDSTDRGS